jgi:chloramphenicol 3-O-phosphotransferase
VPLRLLLLINRTGRCPLTARDLDRSAEIAFQPRLRGRAGRLTGLSASPPWSALGIDTVSEVNINVGKVVERLEATGQVVILNGPPRSGKSSIAVAVQESFDDVWMNLGVDHFKQMTPARFQPGIGLRPGGERPELEPLVVRLYRAMYEAIATHSRLGINVVVDAVHHDAYSVPRQILRTCARQLQGLPVLFVGVRCPVEVALERRRATWGGNRLWPGRHCRRSGAPVARGGPPTRHL